MSTKKTLKFNVRQDGTVTEEVLGNVGNACENLTAEIEKRLGSVTQRVHKAEYYQQEVENVTLQHNKDYN
jgi:hypothetical protein|tara:strand:+ start:620 stop:829 length:210 start_codon:yes stop_codon:yes gene_type:complete